MMETKTLQSNSAFTFSQYFRSLEGKYGDLPPEAVYSALSRTGMFQMYTSNPYTQNRRIKGVSSLPENYGKDDIAKLLLKPNESEQPLRQISNLLEYTAYPYFKLRKTYQDILTYRYYSYPCYLTEEQAKQTQFMREWRLVEKINQGIDPSSIAHEINGQCIRDGKAFYYLRYDVDKSHNSVRYSFLQQLPQDWVKIVGYNNISKYTVSFNMMYFTKPGCDWRQYGKLFEPYINDMYETISSIQKKKSTKIVLSSEMEGNPEVYYQDGRWFYWVTLPVDAVWTFEADDVSRNVISPMAGLIMSMAQIAQYENLQLQLVANPLVACVLGEIEYEDTTGASMEDAYKLSPSGRAFFEALWYQMMSQNNTSGIGFYAAPLKNMHLEQLAEAPSATEISSNGYAYTMLKSGNGLMPLSSEPRAGMLAYSAKIETRYAMNIYRTFEKMMNRLYQKLGLRYEWKFKMFGDIFSESDELENCRKGMTLGLLTETLKYNAMMGHSMLDDLSISNAVIETGLISKRIPLSTSYTQTSSSSGTQGEDVVGSGTEEGGRPTVEGDDIDTEGQESTIDSGY